MEREGLNVPVSVEQLPHDRVGAVTSAAAVLAVALVDQEAALLVSSARRVLQVLGSKKGSASCVID